MLNDRDRVRKDWQKLMTPELLRTNLIRSSVYLAAYELLLQALVEGPLGFFADDFTAEGEPITGAAYREHVLSLGKHKYEASARWFQGWGALTADDVERLLEIREHRNRVAHGIPKIIMSADEDVDPLLLLSMAELIAKIDRWWMLHIVAPTSGDFDHVDWDAYAPEDAVSGRMVVLGLLIAVALGDEERLTEFEAAYGEAVGVPG